MNEVTSYLLVMLLVGIVSVVTALAGPGIVSGIAIGGLGSFSWALGSLAR